jgi:hypothetical protein
MSRSGALRECVRRDEGDQTTVEDPAGGKMLANAIFGNKEARLSAG